MDDVFISRPAHEVLVNKVEQMLLEHARFAGNMETLHQDITVACAHLEALREVEIPRAQLLDVQLQLSFLLSWAGKNLPPKWLQRQIGLRRQIEHALTLTLQNVSTRTT